METVLFKIRRRDNSSDLPYWESFEVEYVSGMTVATGLSAIGQSPNNTEGTKTNSVVWEYSCLEGLCGSCTMIINGRVKLACRTLIDELDLPIRIEPLSKFTVIRDLIVDRRGLGELIGDMGSSVGGDISTKPTVDIVTSYDRQAKLTRFARCMLCGACSEGCPQVVEKSLFSGAFAFAYAVWLNGHIIGNYEKSARIDAVIEKANLSDCQGVGVCEMVCPMQIPLVNAASILNMDAMLHSVRSFFRF